MSDKNSKDIRKQVRNVVQEMLPQMLTEELHKEQYAKLSEFVTARMNEIKTAVENQLEVLNKRSKDMVSYVMRETTKPASKNLDKRTKE